MEEDEHVQYCPQCDNRLPATANYCLSCGYRINPNTTSLSSHNEFTINYLFQKASDLGFHSKKRWHFLVYLIVIIGLRGLWELLQSSLQVGSIEALTASFTQLSPTFLGIEILRYLVEYLIIGSAIYTLREQPDSEKSLLRAILSQWRPILLWFVIYYVPLSFIPVIFLALVSTNPNMAAIYVGVFGFIMLFVVLLTLIVEYGLFTLKPVFLFGQLGFRKSITECDSQLQGYRMSIIGAIVVLTVFNWLISTFLAPISFIGTSISNWLTTLFIAITYHWVTTHPHQQRPASP